MTLGKILVLPITLVVLVVVAISRAIAPESDKGVNNLQLEDATVECITTGNSSDEAQLTSSAQRCLDAYYKTHQPLDEYYGYSKVQENENGYLEILGANDEVLQVWKFTINKEGKIDYLENAKSKEEEEEEESEDAGI